MKIYHGCPSRPKVEEAKHHAPSHRHGAEWNPDKMTPADYPWILDNGAFKAYRNNEPWDVDAFVGRLSQIESMPRGPDFVVLPDVVTNPTRTKERAMKWAGIIQHPTAYPVQDGVTPDDAADLAYRTDSEYLFIGGTVEWKRKHAEAFVETAHSRGLKCHIGRPGDLVWADRIGADSVDTTSIVRNEAWHRLERLEAAGGQTDATAWS